MKDILQILLGGLLVLFLIFGVNYCSKRQGVSPEATPRSNEDILNPYSGKFVFIHSDTCPSCVEAATFLEVSGFSEKVVSIEVAEGGSDILAKLDTVFVPVLVLPDQTVVGFDETLWNELLERGGH